ncbi:MAG TPA: DUF3035 domain-containing protein [Amaricoccus sp.]|uniref:DUF3035 domain-containing protein n=1 Tax=Amaricoccus sp. TaxID=1872485 RepID=UPI001D57EC97|nr:DUF3035 domain-containing protein [Amaricoccus sp.]MCB1372846.1 DUF3035 domain-containing protein [Paracoccaceae bacterium]MCC0067898.1 DUF3035 domain-containing protein [Rhodovulum sp.]MCB1401395.1 DUF3035 domain-containing protein [Paracoccaceae bacterium]HPG21183.1 DUF3035 domain-containing protein [Amaricoccus sp.]HRW16255.1 DUF3035 domain-containing protein [Amaricoccus sp.]
MAGPASGNFFGASLLLAGAVALAGCSGGLAGALRSSGVKGTPDEFLVLPTKPLEMPQNLAALPVPMPGTANLVDYHPGPEAVAGLTGRAGPAGVANGNALVARAGGADPQIRTALAAEDVEYRRTHRGLLLERWFAKDQDALIYKDMTLDAGAEFQRLRARGYQVPSPPPSLVSE